MRRHLLLFCLCISSFSRVLGQADTAFWFVCPEVSQNFNDLDGRYTCALLHMRMRPT
jgi:hypothetical protein